jgi:hypothetical protein
MDNKELTPEILRTFPRLEHLSDEEAEECVMSIRKYSAIVILHMNDEEIKKGNPGFLSQEIDNLNRKNSIF